MTLLYEKAVRENLMKLTPAANFINILRVHFSYESLLSCFYLLRVWLWTNFCTKNVLVKCWWNWHTWGHIRRETVLSLRKSLAIEERLFWPKKFFGRRKWRHTIKYIFTQLTQSSLQLLFVFLWLLFGFV